VLVLGIDGLEPGVIDVLLSEGKLPAFAKLRREGAYGRLQSMKPLLSPIIWTTVATGRTPDAHRIGHFVAVNEQTGEKLPVTSRMRATKALWNIASDAGKRVAVVGWWATWPAETVHGTVVSDHTCYHFLFDDGARGPGDFGGVVFPESRTKQILSLVRRPTDLTYEELAEFANVSREEVTRPFDFNDDLSHFKWALATADSYARIGERLWNQDHPDLALVYIEAVDSTSHLFGHLFRAQSLAGELAAQQQRFGRTVEATYEYADRIVGRYLDLLEPEDTLVVLSDHGFELGAPHDDPSKTRDLRRVSERFHRIEGILSLYGRGVRAYAHIDKPTLLDVAPTVLTLLGLPASEEMPGRVLTDALTIETTLTRVASYETDASERAAAVDAAPVDAQILEHLESLGYLDAASPSGDRNLAAMHFEAGRYEDAAKEFAKLLEAAPDDGGLRASLAGALGALGRYEEAFAQLTEAEKLAPLHPEIHHNRGVVLERQGKTAEAIAAYRTAVRYDPQYQPSRAALRRLTGSAATGREPRTDEERRAAVLAEQAAVAAKSGDYPKATSILDEAARVAPSYSLVHQYRANVAFLAGDRKAAIGALQKALELEPDNALYLQNLRYLERAEDPPPRD
jgi:predicted AlkP superfamily phosphohydrolase/phosphomutase/Flp pilus assembly protein TadD